MDDRKEYTTNVTINGELTITTMLYDDEIELLLAYVNKLNDMHKGLEIETKESDK